MLALEGIDVRYGGLQALRGVSLYVAAGEFVAVIGPNGAGKTTLFKAISGVVPLTAGSITFEGQEIGTLSAAARPHRGIAHVPEGRQVFGDLTVEENLLLGTEALAGRGTATPQRGAGFRPIPDPGGAPKAAGRSAVRWAAANAGNRPGSRPPRRGC